MEISDILQMDQGYVGQNRNIPPRLKKRAQSLCWRYNQSPPGPRESGGLFWSSCWAPAIP